MREICFASNNKHKLEEVRSILGPDFRVLSLDDIHCTAELPETQTTFQGNALQKATFLFHQFHIPCFADDSGLEVEALNGSPGVFSARYAGPNRSDNDNIQLLLTNLGDKKNRSAQFKTVIAFIDSRGSTHFFEGVIRGSILREKKGRSGFGYDPIFVPLGYTKTFAEMNPEEKNSISHRALAVKKFAQFLKLNFLC